MRGLTPFTVLLCAAASAQNWALLNPAYKYNYSNDGSDTISNQIFVTHIDTLGPDSFRYELNRIGVVEDNSVSNYFSQCEDMINQFLVRSGQMQFLGGSVIQGPHSWTLAGADTLALPINAPVSYSWMNPDGSSASVLIADTATILGVVDSIKWVGYSGGDTLLLSKDHGIIRSGPMAWVEPAPTLVGLGGAVETGAQFPSYKSLFNYLVGDILQYSEASDYVGGDDCVHFSECTVKYRILSRADLSGRTEYTMRAIHACDYWSSNVWDWTSCGSYSQHWTDTIFIGVDHDKWSIDNPFCGLWRMETFPGALTSMEWMSGITRALVTAELDTAQHYLLRSATLLGPNTPYSLLCPNLQDTSAWLTTEISNFSTSFLDKVGLTFEQVYNFESGGSRSLIGYLIQGAEYGTVTPDGILLGVDAAERPAGARIYPNPANDHLALSNAATGSVVRILDTHGRLQLNHRTTSPVEVLDVRALVPGMYLLIMDGFQPQRFVIAR